MFQSFEEISSPAAVPERVAALRRELKSRELKAASLTLGIELDNSGTIEWGPTIAIAKGSCYWTNPLILRGAK